MLTVYKYYNAFQLRFFDMVKKATSVLQKKSTRYLNKEKRKRRLRPKETTNG